MVISSHYSHQEEQCILGFCCYYFYSPAKITCETFRICVCCLSPIGRSFSAPPICLNILPFCALGRLPTCPCLPSSSASASSEAVEVCCVCEDGRRKRGELTAPQEQPSATVATETLQLPCPSHRIIVFLRSSPWISSTYLCYYKANITLFSAGLFFPLSLSYFLVGISSISKINDWIQNANHWV